MEIWYTLTGLIDQNSAQQFIAWVNNQLYSQSVEKLKFLISSGGGDTDSAIRIYSYLKALPIEVETIGFGQIDSAANIIFLAGKERNAVEGCRFLLHEGTFNIGMPNAPLRNHEETLIFFRELFRKHIEILARETKKKPDEIRKILSEGAIMTAEEAKSFGIAYNVIQKLPLVKQVK
jgi:ATP-dependent Clp protease protease subunit